MLSREKSCFMLCPLQSVPDLHVSMWLQYPETISTGINWRQFGLWVTYLHIQMGQEQEHKPRHTRGKAVTKGILHYYTRVIIHHSLGLFLAVHYRV